MQVRPLGESPLSLTNDGQLSIFALGCGSAFARTLGQNNFLIIKGDVHLLVDCGTKTPTRLRKLGVEVTEIRNILLTHSHADHIGGLEEVMLMGRYVAGRKPTALIEERYQRRLWNDSLKGGAASNERHDGKFLGFDDFWEIVRPTPNPSLPRDAASFSIGDLNVTIFRTNHFPEQAMNWQTAAYSVGLLLDNRVLFTGDTKFDSDLISDFDQHFPIEWIFQDAQFFTGGVHASVDELDTLPAHVKERMLLMHYADSWKDKVPDIENRGYHGFVQEYCYYDFD